MEGSEVARKLIVPPYSGSPNLSHQFVMVAVGVAAVVVGAVVVAAVPPQPARRDAAIRINSKLRSIFFTIIIFSLLDSISSLSR
jgi:hypothetical protein